MLSTLVAAVVVSGALTTDVPAQGAPAGTPILLPVGKRGLEKDLYRLTSIEDGVLFDHDGDGIKDLTSWTDKTAPVGFLALDRNGNGTIDNGTELFGNHTVPGRLNGFAALQTLSEARLGHVDADLPIYEKLLIWVDKNHNGISEPKELEKLSTYYTAVGLGYSADKTVDEHGNQFKYKGWAEVRTGPGRNAPKIGEQGPRIEPIYDVSFVTR